MIKVTLAETREFGACVSDNNEPHPRSCVPWMLASGLVISCGEGCHPSGKAAAKAIAIISPKLCSR